MRHRRLCQGLYRRGAQAPPRLLRPAPCPKRPVFLKLVGGSPTTSSPSTPSVGPAAHAPPNASGAVLESRSRQPTFPRDPQQANTLDASRSPGGSANGAGAQVVQSWVRSGYLARVWTTRPRLLPRVLRFRGSDCLGRSAMRPIRVDRSRSSSKTGLTRSQGLGIATPRLSTTRATPGRFGTGRSRDSRYQDTAAVAAAHRVK